MRPLSDELHASGAFDRESCGPDDQVRLTITLSNSGDAPILAKAFCGSAELPALDSGPVWGSLAFDGPLPVRPAAERPPAAISPTPARTWSASAAGAARRGARRRCPDGRTPAAPRDIG